MGQIYIKDELFVGGKLAIWGGGNSSAWYG